MTCCLHENMKNFKVCGCQFDNFVKNIFLPLDPNIPIKTYHFSLNLSSKYFDHFLQLILFDHSCRWYLECKKK